MARVLAIGDVHLPVARKGYLQFCIDLYNEWKCNQVVFMGDIVDWHSVSFHTKHPECPGPSDEYKRTLALVRPWYEAFPRARVCIGNHDERVIRLAESASIPSFFIKSYNSIWKTVGWKWDYEHIIDDVYYFHGTGNSGENPASIAVRKMLMSVVMGHNHTAFGVKWFANPQRRIFGCDVGCGIDDRKAQFAYGRHTKRRSILGAAVIIDGVPYPEIMPCSRGERYHDDKFE